MNTLIQADIFFFITSIAVILVTAIVLVICWYVFKLTKILHRLAEKIENEADEYIEASADVREKIFEHPFVEMVLGKKKTRKSKRD